MDLSLIFHFAFSLNDNLSQIVKSLTPAQHLTMLTYGHHQLLICSTMTLCYYSLQPQPLYRIYSGGKCYHWGYILIHIHESDCTVGPSWHVILCNWWNVSMSNPSRLPRDLRNILFYPLHNFSAPDTCHRTWLMRWKVSHKARLRTFGFGVLCAILRVEFIEMSIYRGFALLSS